MTFNVSEAEARAAAHALIQNHIGPDHKVLSMSEFFLALVQALKAARDQGQADSLRAYLCRG